MASAANVIGGPATVTVGSSSFSGGTALGHVQGGVKANFAPEQREVLVDQFGSTPMRMRHTGDKLTVTTPLAEYTADTLAEINESGNDQTAASGAKYIGFGREATYFHTTTELEITPQVSADAAKSLRIYKATVTGAVDFSWSNEDETILSLEWTALGKEDATAGQLLGLLRLTAS